MKDLRIKGMIKATPALIVGKLAILLVSARNPATGIREVVEIAIEAIEEAIEEGIATEATEVGIATEVIVGTDKTVEVTGRSAGGTMRPNATTAANMGTWPVTAKMVQLT